jgi:replicative DNA helicase
MARAHELPVPSAVDTERVLLGTMLTNATQLLTVAEILPPGPSQWFYQASHRRIYEAMLTLLERHEVIDLETVTDVLRRRGQLDSIGGSIYLAELMEGCVTTANVAAHARIIRDKALYRGMINLGSDLSAGAYAQDELPALITRAQQGLLQLAGAQTTAALTTLHTVLTDTIRQAQQVRAHELTGLHTGFHGLNELTGGFQPSNLIILAARPSHGKRALAMPFAVAAARALRATTAAPVVVFSLEMSTAELGLRVLCSEARLDAQRLKRGELDTYDWGRVFSAADRLSELPMLIDETSSLSVLDIRTRVTRVQREQGLGMVIIDYWQLMHGAGPRRDNRQEEVSTISRELKILAKELNVPVIALSQLNRDVEGRSPPVPVLSDLRSSGAIEQDADVVMFIYRGDLAEARAGGVAKLLLAKQRNGPTGEMALRFNDTCVRFEELAPAHQERLARSLL